MNPYRAVQGLLHVVDGRPSGVLGSCFRLHATQRYVTAAHCVGDLTPTDIAVLNPLDEDADFRCSAIQRHPEADVAVIEVADRIPEGLEQLSLADWGRRYGAAVHCFGMVADTGRGFANVTQRVIGGIIQRDYIHAEGPYRFPALEFSEPIPKGMSGGPAFLASAPTEVIGIARGSIHSEVVISRLEEITDGRETFRERVTEITRYGVIVWLDRVRDWLEDNLRASV